MPYRFSRRLFLSGCAAATLAAGSRSYAQTGIPELAQGLRGALDVTAHGLKPDRKADQSRAFEAVLKEASLRRVPVFLPPGDYVLSEIALPEAAHLTGIAGATRLRFGGGRSFLTAENLKPITLSDLVLDGGGQALGEGIEGLVDARNIDRLTIENCIVTGASKHGLRAERCSGRIAQTEVSDAANAGVFAIDSRSLAITGNTVSDCGNGGILVHRSETGQDGAMVSGNRIANIRADDGGTGEHGNGINLYRAANVMVTGNHVSDCAFSAIRANAATDVQISNNQCLRSGETAIYSEFGFEGAIVSSNLVDGAANGILIVNFDQGGRLATVSDNIVRNLSLTGPYIHDGAGFGFGIAAEADTVISGNVIENAPRYGLMLGWGPYMRNIVATGNLVRKAGTGCAVTIVEGAGTALIANNLFEDVSDGAIIGYRWNAKATGDLTAADAAQFAHLALSGNRQVKG